MSGTNVNCPQLVALQNQIAQLIKAKKDATDLIDEILKQLKEQVATPKSVRTDFFYLLATIGKASMISYSPDENS